MGGHLDVVSAIGRFAAELQGDCNDDRRELILAILQRWQHDRDLTEVTEASRRTARDVFRRFATER